MTGRDAGLALRGLLPALVPVATGLLLAACSGGEGAAQPSATAPASSGILDGGHIYLALGDSLAAGVGASSPDLSYVGLVESALEQRLGEKPPLENLAVSGATTGSLIDGQLPKAEALLRGGDVLLVTVNIGGNDFASLFGNQACVEEAMTPDCPLASVLDPVRMGADTIFSRLRAAGPDVPIVLLEYPNLFSGSGHPFEGPAHNALSRLDEVLHEVGQHYNLTMADPTPEFEGNSLKYTHLADAGDPHPNDAGHAVLAAALEQAIFP